MHESSPFNSEPPSAALDEHPLTAVDAFYCRNHGPIPDISPERWRLAVNGLVAEPMNISFDYLTTAFDGHTVVATLQCAGNRRAGFNLVREVQGEDPWGSGAIGTATWRGARLGNVLRAAGVHTGEGLHVGIDAPDVSQLASPAQPFGGSIPLKKALADEVLLAWEMNGAPLPRVHGGPVRLVVPGYIGARSVKWPTSIEVRDAPSDNYFQATAYRIFPADTDPSTVEAGEGISLSSLAVTSDILTPQDGAHLTGRTGHRAGLCACRG